MPINQRNAGFISATYQPLKVADAPTIGAATGGDASASVAFTAPANVGGSAITEYYAVSNPDRVTVSGASSPINVTGLTNGTPYTFSVWALNTYGPSPFSGASGSVTPAAPTGLFGGGEIGGQTNVIQYILIGTTGNSTDFGDLINPVRSLSACGSSSKGLFAGGVNTSISVFNSISYVTISSSGNASDWGDLSSTGVNGTACSNSTRGLFALGSSAVANGSNVIDYVTFSSAGNSIDFGDLIIGRNRLTASASSVTGVFAAGENNSGTRVNVIDYVTIASAGNATDFGDVAHPSGNSSLDALASCASSTRMLIGGGTYGTRVNVIQYLTIASTGNTIDFGDLLGLNYNLSGCSSATRAIFGGGNNGSRINVIQYRTISSTGNAIDFGDLLATTEQLAACSNAHGGL